jgi:predicted transcriptional regulator
MSKNYNQGQVLDNLFGSRVRVRILKFLFRNYPVHISIQELSKRIQESQDEVKKEIRDLEKIGLIKKI